MSIIATVMSPKKKPREKMIWQDDAWWEDWNGSYAESVKSS